MKPLKLTMQAFGSYGKKTLINFEEPDQNLFLITGDTGAGKTTIFDAIVFALYGEASSTVNKKEGIVLQSQFVDLDQEPFVELVFSEGYGLDCDIYTVRRVPRHLKTITKGAGKGVATREIGSSVMLTMPDGTEYPQKEADKKLEEIVGLTKSQFMQVAMIAQGEFMELLRAKSDDKKVIFRKLFNTELFQNIVDELNNRKKAKEKEIAVIKTECQTHAARMIVPEEYDRYGVLDDLQKRIAGGELAAIGQFLEELNLLLAQLRKDKDAAEHEYLDADKTRDIKRDAYTNAQNLQKFYEQFDKAEHDLAECKAAEIEIKAAEKLITQLQAAYEIENEYQRYKDAKKSAADTKTALQKQKDALPEIKKAAGETAGKEAQLKEEYDQVLKNFSKISERVTKALELLDKIDAAQAKVEKRSADLEFAQEKKADVKDKTEKLDAQEKNWKKQLEELGDAEKQLALWEVERREVSDIKEAVEELAGLRRDVKRRLKAEEESRKNYALAKERYINIKDDYEKKRQGFLDSQAGFLARKLADGKPCPVCGSLEHPNPCQWNEEHAELSEEAIDELGKEVEKLRTRQEELAAESKTNAELRIARETAFNDECEKLRMRMKKSGRDIPEPFTLGAATKLTEEWEESVRLREEQLEGNVKTLQSVQKSLSGVDEKRKEFEALAEEANTCVTEAKAALESSRATLQGLVDAKDYPTKEAAQSAMNQAQKEKEDTDLAYSAAKKASSDAKKAKDTAEALIEKYTQELPKQEEQLDMRKAAYESIMLKKNLSETEWKELTGQHEKTEIDVLRKSVDEYNTKLAAAKSLKASATESIGNQQRPVMEDIQKEMEDAEEKRKAAEAILEKCKEYDKTDGEVYAELAPRADVRQVVVEEHAKLDTLYRLVSGNVSGSRMDLETYVQRYYLEKILYAANRRFADMSAGQFELRMTDLEKAGEGKNKGLDLMVYSNVTGKEREVRTLSGGESFMAALSLALGMADQIQENSAAINLDIMFIDEGFGSLDEHSRNQAVRVLLEMAEGSKTIGIISHVIELKQEIEDQLLVTKDENGSHAAWQIS